MMNIQKLTKEQAAIISGFTGILCGEFSDFHSDVEKRIGRSVQTFEFGLKEFMTEVKKLYKADFIEIGTVGKEQAKAQAVPEGFVLMPIKPTETMVAAVAKEHEGDAFLPYSIYDAYVKQAMIEAQEQGQ